MDLHPSVSVVVPVLNGRDKILRCLESLTKSEYPLSEIIVVDNGSTDGTIEAIQLRFPDVRLICNGKNLFLAEARNIGIRNSVGEFIFLIDYDNIVVPSTVTCLVEVMSQDASIGIVGPIAYYLADPSRIWSAGVRVNLMTSKNTDLASRQLDRGQFQEVIEVDYFPNAFMVRRSMVSQIGLFDGIRYPQAGHEPDFGFRAQRGGYRVVLAPKAKVYHDTLPPSAGLSGWLHDLHFAGARGTGNIKTYCNGRTRVLFMQQYARRKFWIFLLFFYPAFVVFYVALTLLNRRPDLTLIYLRGSWDGIATVITGKSVPQLPDWLFEQSDQR